MTSFRGQKKVGEIPGGPRGWQRSTRISSKTSAQQLLRLSDCLTAVIKQSRKRVTSQAAVNHVCRRPPVRAPV